MLLKCVYESCTNTKNYYKCSYKYSPEELSYFSFPSDEDICEKWLSFCSVNFLKRKIPIRKLRTSSYKICEVHFLKSDFKNSLATKKLLKPGVVPSVTKTKESSSSDDFAHSKSNVSHSSNISDLVSPQQLLSQACKPCPMLNLLKIASQENEKLLVTNENLTFQNGDVSECIKSKRIKKKYYKKTRKKNSAKIFCEKGNLQHALRDVLSGRVSLKTASIRYDVPSQLLKDSIWQRKSFNNNNFEEGKITKRSSSRSLSNDIDTLFQSEDEGPLYAPEEKDSEDIGSCVKDSALCEKNSLSSENVKRSPVSIDLRRNGSSKVQIISGLSWRDQDDSLYFFSQYLSSELKKVEDLHSREIALLKIQKVLLDAQNGNFKK